MKINANALLLLPMALACLTCAARLDARPPSRSCSDGRAVAVLKKHISEDVVPEELNYTVRRSGRVLIISGRYKEPTIGYEPVARVDAVRCRVMRVTWR